MRPLGYDYADPRSLHCESQILWGESLMLASVMEPNAPGRVVYIPENNVCEFRLNIQGEVQLTPLPKGDQFRNMSQDELVFFIKPNQLLALGPGGKNSLKAQAKTLSLFGFVTQSASLEFLEDDGITPEVKLSSPSRLGFQVESHGSSFCFEGPP
jgi:alpha-glucosidase